MVSTSFPFPEVNAALNGFAGILLTAGFINIRLKKINAHRFCMISALAVSVVFLCSYLTYHYQTGARTPFRGEGFWRPFYYTMLISHIVLAIVVVPLVLRTFYLGIKGKFSLHRRWAKWTFPIWYYVSITGVLVYLFLYQIFPVST
jgi:putative membrane protein